MSMMRIGVGVLVAAVVVAGVAIWWQVQNPCVRYEEFQTVRMAMFAKHGMVTAKRCIRE